MFYPTGFLEKQRSIINYQAIDNTTRWIFQVYYTSSAPNSLSGGSSSGSNVNNQQHSKLITINTFHLQLG
uniref:Uncharacterized protein n=1 Tax=Nelumbo nucifera TaxID=4432 RepID=A0A822Z362_NELNU|nr:TPA_asm: hypothetical protein HUJ06_008782 [Nelumbo nucifera]